MQSDDLGLVNSLRAWLIKRAGPDSGIGYEGGDFDWDRLRSRQARVTLHGSDADFIAQNFHGDGAAALLAAIERLVAERDAAREALKPFAKYTDELNGFLDNHNQPIPDDQGPGWVYVTIGDFRRARQALKDAP